MSQHIKKHSTILLVTSIFVALLASAQSIATQETKKSAGGTFYFGFEPQIEATGRIYFSGDEARALNNPQSSSLKGIKATGKIGNSLKSANLRMGFYTFYDNRYDRTVGGVYLGTIGDLADDGADFGLDDVFAYMFLLPALGLNLDVFDVYLQAGRFNMEFYTAHDAGQPTWKAEIDDLLKEDKVNIFTELLIADMFTLSAGVSLAPFEELGSLAQDVGFGLSFDYTFGMHTIEASAAYTLDLTNNKGNDQNGKSKLGTPDQVITEKARDFYEQILNFPTKQKKDLSIVAKYPSDFDQLGFSLAYTLDLGQIQLMPFFNIEFNGLFANKKAFLAYINPLIGWSAGVQFTLQDPTNDYSLLSLGIDLGGRLRKNDNYLGEVTEEKLDFSVIDPDTGLPKKSTKTFEKTIKQQHIANEVFKGFGFTLQSDVLKAVMGKNYLGISLAMAFEFNQPKTFGYPIPSQNAAGDFLDADGNVIPLDPDGFPTSAPAMVTKSIEVQRKGYLRHLIVSLTQYLLNEAGVTLTFDLKFGLYNIAPLYLKGFGYIGNISKLIDLADPTKQHAAFQTYIDLGINASFVGGYAKKL